VDPQLQELTPIVDGDDREIGSITLVSRPHFTSLLPEPAVRPYLIILTALFVVAFLAGMLAPPSIRGGLVDVFEMATEPYTNQSGGVLFLLILLNNIIATILIVSLGVVFGILPVIGVVSNGFLLGVLWRQGAEISGYGQAALRVLPHGLFEIPALLLASAYGLWIGMAAIQRARDRRDHDIRGMIKHALQRYAAIVIPLLVIAAAIETTLVVM